MEHHSNKNFCKYGIENIGEDLQKELIKINVDQSKIKLRSDVFYFFQRKVVYITNNSKCIKISTDCTAFNPMIKIVGFQNCN